MRQPITSNEENREALKHRDALADIRSILSKPSGQRFFKYLLESFEVTELPEVGIEGLFLHDKLGFLRAGNSIFQLIAQADPLIAGQLISIIQKDKYDAIAREAANARSSNPSAE